MTEPIISLEKPPAGWQKEVFTLASLFSHGNLLHTAQSMPAHLSIATTPIGLSPSPLSSPSSTLCQQSTGMLTKTKNMLNSKRTSNNDCLKSFKMHESSVVCLCVCFGFFFKCARSTVVLTCQMLVCLGSSAYWTVTTYGMPNRDL